jgi:arsenate reductase
MSEWKRRPNPLVNVLFLCTGNSARSIMAEALLNHHGEGRIRAFSAGSSPKGAVHPQALETLSGRGIPVQQLRSKSWDEFGVADAPVMNVVVTVCDRAAAETCPIWRGHPGSEHWSIPDPAAVEGTDDQVRAAFARTFEMLDARISEFVSRHG